MITKASYRKAVALMPLLAALCGPVWAQTPPVPAIAIHVNKIAAKVSPTLYGLMTEEINYSYEGGLYGELVHNRSFQPAAPAVKPDMPPVDQTQPEYWTAIGGAHMTLDKGAPLNNALAASLKLDTTSATKTAPAGLSNPGFWGVPVRGNTTYRASFYAKAADGFKGEVTLKLQTSDGKTIFASATVKRLTGEWAKYDVTLKTGPLKASKDNVFTLTTATPGTIWLQQVSLFPPTWNGRANGNRPDIMQLMADMKPQFLRLPGGNYLEGNLIPERFDWKKTIGDTAKRPGHPSPWHYWSTDGFGLMEYLEWCEDLKMEPVLAVYAGYSLRQDRVAAGPDLQPYVQDALDEIEFLTGDATTKWGAERAKLGHPRPFPLHYVEIGNEDWFDKANTYDARFTQFYDAIKAKYPQLQLISTITPDRPAAEHVTSRTPDLVDQHLYPSSEGEMEARAHEFDTLPRTGPKIFVGEWATRVGSPTPNMAGALGDAAWMTGMERNSDIVVMESYAPLFTNVSHILKGSDPATSMQWPSDLIGYDALSGYGSPSYYAQQMFSTHHGDEVLASEATDVPTWSWQPPQRTRNGVAEPLKPAKDVPSLFYVVTRDSQTGTLYLKVVNRNPTPQPVRITLDGVASVAAAGEAIVLRADSADATNTIAGPKKVVPVTQKVSGLGTSFTRDFPPFSITVLQLHTK